MKPIIFVMAIFCSSALAQEWKPVDKSLFVASSVLLAADWSQTRYIAKNPTRFHELNPILGPHPSVGRVNTYFAGSMIANYLITDYLSPENRKYFQYVVIGVEGTVVARNARIGIKIGF